MLRTRIKLYRQLEKERKRPLIVYVTSTRQNAGGQISGDSVAEFQAQLEALPPKTKALDLLLVSVGGDPTVAWRIVSLVRERYSKFAVLVPHAAFSAATLIVLGADEIVMHPNGNLGPTDPQITVPKNSRNEEVRFGSEDLMAFLTFVKQNVSKDEKTISDLFKKFCEDAGSSIAIGVAQRGSQLSVAMGEKLLQTHMTGEAKKQVKAIAEKLTKDYFHHGYPVNRSEAAEIGLKVVSGGAKVEGLLWEIWTDISEDLKLRSPFNAIEVLRENPATATLFSPIPTAIFPANLPPEVMQQVIQQVASTARIEGIPGSPYETTHALMESTRLATKHVTRGMIFASRLPDMNFKISNIVEKQGWVSGNSVWRTKHEPVAVAVQVPAESEDSVTQPTERTAPEGDVGQTEDGGGIGGNGAGAAEAGNPA